MAGVAPLAARVVVREPPGVVTSPAKIGKRPAARTPVAEAVLRSTGDVSFPAMLAETLVVPILISFVLVRLSTVTVPLKLKLVEEAFGVVPKEAVVVLVPVVSAVTLGAKAVTAPKEGNTDSNNNKRYFIY